MFLWEEACTKNGTALIHNGILNTSGHAFKRAADGRSKGGFSR